MGKTAQSYDLIALWVMSPSQISLAEIWMLTELRLFLEILGKDWIPCLFWCMQNSVPLVVRPRTLQNSSLTRELPGAVPSLVTLPTAKSCNHDLSSALVLSFWEGRIRWNHTVWNICIWLLSHSLPLRFIQIVSCINSLTLFLITSIPSYRHSSLFIHLPIEGH